MTTISKLLLTRASDSIQKAAGDMKLPVENDGNNPKAPAMGLFTTDIMIDKFGYRHSSLAAYLPKSTVDGRGDRLTLCTGVVATKLQTNDGGTEVTGVYILDHLDKSSARQCFVNAKREVIVCCGTHFSPQLLMLRYHFFETPPAHSIVADSMQRYRTKGTS